MTQLWFVIEGGLNIPIGLSTSIKGGQIAKFGNVRPNFDRFLTIFGKQDFFFELILEKLELAYEFGLYILKKKSS